MMGRERGVEEWGLRVQEENVSIGKNGDISAMVHPTGRSSHEVQTENIEYRISRTQGICFMYREEAACDGPNETA